MPKPWRTAIVRDSVHRCHPRGMRVGSSKCLVVLLLLASCAVAQDNGNERAPSVRAVDVHNAVAQRHREVPSDPWMPRSAISTAGAMEHCSPWELGPFKSIQVNVDDLGCNIVGDAANEPSIAIDPTDPNRLLIGWRQFDTVLSNFRQGGWAHSHDRGRTWTFPGVLEPGVFSSDPVLDVDADGNFYYYSLQPSRGPGNWACYLYKSFDGGVTWPQEVYAFGGDKAWMVIDRTDGIGRGNVYCAWSPSFSCCSGTFTRSTNGGAAFMPPVFGGPFLGTMSVAHDGTLFLSGGNQEVGVKRSTNAQDPRATPTFTPLLDAGLGGVIRFAFGPNPAGLLGQSWIATDHSQGPGRGNVYLLASVQPFGRNDPLDVMFARSTDGGQTWSEPIRINDDPIDSGAWQWFGTMSVAPTGRIDVVWNDTRNDPTVTFSELYYSNSFDQGITWSRSIPVSLPFNHFLGYPNQAKLGDYYHMRSDAGGANVAYAATFNGEQDVYFLRIEIDCAVHGCDDGNVCTDDSCDPATGCVNTPNMEPCNDRDGCTMNDTCSGGVCVGGPPPDCDDGEVCVNGICRSPITWHVDDDNCPGPGAGTEADPFCMIQAGIDAAKDSDEVVVAPGTYNELIDFLGKAITVRGSGGADVTIIDGAGLNDSAVKSVSGEGPDTVLDGFTITGGTGGVCFTSTCGGGMLNAGSSPTVTNCTFGGNSAREGGGMLNDNSNPTVTNCTFAGNRALEGGGMLNNNSSPTVTNCTFGGNSATNFGGGIQNRNNSSPTLTNCTFSGNSAEFGGGMLNGISSPTMTNCTFSGNTAIFDGGGMWNTGDPTLTNCTFSGNTATNFGGGMWNAGDPMVTNCTFTGNTASRGGGGMFNRSSSPTVTNCTISGNTAGNNGGGMLNLDSNPMVTNCTFSGNMARNFGGGMFNDSSFPTVTNCILWGDSPDEILNNSSSLIITFSDVQGDWPGEGNIAVDPLFVDADGLDDVPGTQDDNLRLLPGSPCIDGGNNEAVLTETVLDLDGHPRFVDHPFTPDTGNGQPPIVDMGAYEFQGPLRAVLDIKPGSCPNPLNPNPKSKGVVPMALVGGESFDVTNVNLDTLALFRPDGVGESVVPLARSRGQTRTFEDVAGPAGDDPCACSEAGGDGFDDLVLKFSSREMVRAFQLDSLERSASLTIALRGELFDGTGFAALDCVRIVGSAIIRVPELDRAVPANP